MDKTIINMDDFRKTGTVRNLTDVLKEIGAVDVQRINPLISSPGDEVSIRGLNEDPLVIEIDGRRINHTGHNGRYIVDWSALNMDDIKLGDRWKITPGGRYYSLDKDTYFAWFEAGGTSPAFPTTGKKETDEDWFASLKVDFQANDTTALYAAVSRSYRLPCP